MKNIGIILAVMGGVLYITNSVTTQIPPEVIQYIEKTIKETKLEFITYILVALKKIIQAGGLSVVIGALVSLYNGRIGSFFILFGIAGGLFFYTPDLIQDFNKGNIPGDVMKIMEYIYKKGYGFLGVTISFFSFFLVRSGSKSG